MLLFLRVCFITILFCFAYFVLYTLHLYHYMYAYNNISTDLRILLLSIKSYFLLIPENILGLLQYSIVCYNYKDTPVCVLHVTRFIK